MAVGLRHRSSSLDRAEQLGHSEGRALAIQALVTKYRIGVEDDLKAGKRGSFDLKGTAKESRKQMGSHRILTGNEGERAISSLTQWPL